MIVLFDGTKHRPWGRMIFCEESGQPVPPVPRMAFGGSSRRLRACASQLAAFRSSREIAAICGLTVDQANHAIHHLVACGDLETEQAVGMTKGRHGGQRYRWRER